MNYDEFLKRKIIVSEDFGFEPKELSKKLHLHQPAIVDWALRGGRRAIFASFGLGKTFMQLEIARQCILKENRPFLIVCPLGVVGEFKRDNSKLCTGYEIEYITDTNGIENYENKIYITNYERVRKGDIDPSKFSGVSFDEASILRNLKTETTNYVLEYFGKIPYRFVATATPTPNDFIEILNYAQYLGVADRGHLLTRFFKRDSQKAGNLKLLENKKDEFWKWVSTWAVFITKPHDLGFADDGYDLPPLNIIEHRLDLTSDNFTINKKGDLQLFKDTTKDLLSVSREKRDSIPHRVNQTLEILNQNKGEKFTLWHHLESERDLLEKSLKGENFRSVFGSQRNEIKEKNLIDFSNGEYQYLITKPTIAGSGCNLQEHCNNCIFVGIDYKFNDFIQAIHRFYRFGQTKPVNVHIIYTNSEDEVFNALMKKWAQHEELQREMISIVKEYGLNSNLIKSQMERQIFENGKKITIGNATLYNNDTTIIHANKDEMPDNSVDMILTSIPFGDHYEYSDNYNDFGHNDGNENFFKQMDYLTPNLLRVLKPGRIAAIHVKDRPRYSHQTGVQFFTIDPFSDNTVAHFRKHGFYFMGRITVTTDVVSENNQTYRLGWGEQRKDATKMGVGIPEYILLFRKKPSHTKNAYADDPVSKEINEYLLSLWQLDAHSYWKSSGNRFLTSEELRKYDVGQIYRSWQRHNSQNIYDFKEHLRVSEELDELGKLSKLFMTLPPTSTQDCVWTDIQRTNTLNAKQVSSKKEKHICPLQLDVIERLINRFTKRGEIVDDPFGGLFSTAYKALELGRKAISVELNSEYFADGTDYINAINHKINMPTLFDLIEETA